MSFQIKILLVSFVVAVVLGLIILPILKKLKISQEERSEGPKSHLSKKGTPTKFTLWKSLKYILILIYNLVYNVVYNLYNK